MGTRKILGKKETGVILTMSHTECWLIYENVCVLAPYVQYVYKRGRSPLLLLYTLNHGQDSNRPSR